jgi:hypothetical protein
VDEARIIERAIERRAVGNALLPSCRQFDAIPCLTLQNCYCDLHSQPATHMRRVSRYRKFPENSTRLPPGVARVVAGHETPAGENLARRDVTRE